MSEIRMTHRLSPAEAEVVRALAACDMRIGAAALVVHKNRNTVMYWLDQIRKHTGLDPRKFYDLIQLLQLAGEGA